MMMLCVIKAGWWYLAWSTGQVSAKPTAMTIANTLLAPKVRISKVAEMAWARNTKPAHQPK